MTYDVVQIQKILPHRYPFLLLDRVTQLNKGESIEGYKNVSISEPVFQGHFPGHPIYPGVMIIEGMAQAGGVLAFESSSKEAQQEAKEKVVYFMSIDKAKFRSPV
ncbi:MAG TPA: beta-hydroxyacyl-ACP dehydratase, partial [Campylobacterales bacterium]|nr:beta-hydroxyacyl-ACP dehydratase [Campylobacterales bacterium]